MKVICYLPYDDYNDTDFSVNNDYYKGDDYENALKQSLKMIDSYIDNNEYRFSMNTFNESQKENLHYSSCEAILYNVNGENESVENLVNHISLNEPYICALSFDYSSMEEEFEYEFKTWLITFDKISKLNCDDEYKFSNQPRKTMMVKFVDETGFESCVDFIGCRIVSKEDMIVMIVDKLEFKKCN